MNAYRIVSRPYISKFIHLCVYVNVHQSLNYISAITSKKKQKTYIILIYVASVFCNSHYTRIQNDTLHLCSHISRIELQITNKNKHGKAQQKCVFFRMKNTRKREIKETRRRGTRRKILFNSSWKWSSKMNDVHNKMFWPRMRLHYYDWIVDIDNGQWKYHCKCKII